MGEIFERVIPKVPLEWNGERLTTAVGGQIEIEHLHRYFLARELCRGLDVLDVAAGEGYGTALLAEVARSVVGVEISAPAVMHAVEAYRGPNIRFLEGDARRLPLDTASVDAVVSFETIEHLYEHDQFLAEVRRVLRPGGRFIVSSPESEIYSPSGSRANPYHVRELSRAEFGALLRSSFAQVRLLGQRPMLGSALMSEEDKPSRSLTFEKRGPHHFEASAGLMRPAYLIGVASDWPVVDVPDSLYIESSEVGAVLAAAGAAEAATAELTSLRTRANAAESAHAAARSELALSIQREAAAQANAESARAETTTACLQRDIARAAARRAAAASEGHWRGRIAELEQRAKELSCDNADREAKITRLTVQVVAQDERYHKLTRSISWRFASGLIHLPRAIGRSLRWPFARAAFHKSGRPRGWLRAFTPHIPSRGDQAGPTRI